MIFDILKKVINPSTLVFADRWGNFGIYTLYNPPEVPFKLPPCAFLQNIPQHIPCSLKEGLTFRIPQGGMESENPEFAPSHSKI